ncbi:STAS domain-containing protein [Rehaibacterium terrae]|jgi:anti-anti-sigma regulatory factor|uniref:Anti-anti-sigma regulatory factor n=1 Tax=Rehaibacterium terrae TaxID=1341696 RepID=A0A7W7Y2G4_9GAMM|nr:STAS domain-containing protein [Rehaibacterium terrae]MBB5016618.1 anti-anti-sigma regulatory factor [Rehaibacterium terrae]
MPAIALASDLGIEQSAELKAALAPHLASKRPVVVDGAGVQRIHSASLQLLCAFCRDRQAAGRKTRLENPSPALRDAARILALTSVLGLSDSPETPHE